MHDNDNTYPKTFDDVVTTQTCKIREGHGEECPSLDLSCCCGRGSTRRTSFGTRQDLRNRQVTFGRPLTRGLWDDRTVGGDVES